MSAAAADDAARADSVAVLHALRDTRRRKRLGSLEWFELAYKVYVAAFLAIVGIALISNWVGDTPLTAAQTADVRAYTPAVLGTVLALVVALGLRSGARGGPISVEPADVQYLLLAPVSRRSVLGRPAVQQIRRAAFGGAAAGAVGGQLLGRRLGEALIPWTATGALAGGAIGLALVSVALAAHTIRLRRWQATIIGGALLAWQAVSTPGRTHLTGPLDTVGSIVLWPWRVHAVDLVIPAAVALLALVAYSRLEFLSVEALARRSALVKQLRFAVTMRDLRTVVLLRRQLSNEQHRNRPWFRTPSLIRSAVAKRGVQSVARFPASRLMRMALLTAIAAAAQVVAFRGTTPAVVVSGLAAFVLGLECLEAFAQEVDQPDRADSLPRERGWLLVRHLPVAAIVSAMFGVLGAAGVYAVERTTEAWQLSLLLVIPVVWGGASGAVLNVLAGIPEPIRPGSVSEMLPPEISGVREVFRTLRPLLVAVSGSLPVLAARAAARHDHHPIPPALQASVAVALVIAAVVWWSRKRDAVRAKVGALWAAGDAEFKARHSRAGGSQ